MPVFGVSVLRARASGFWSAQPVSMNSSASGVLQPARIALCTTVIGMEDGQALELVHYTLRRQSTPYLPHGWECGYLFDETTRTLFCGDLLTQPGTGSEPLTGGDNLGPSEAFCHQMDYFSHT